jgi:hypothetical protein
VANPRRTDVHPEETEYDFVYNVEVDHNDILMDTAKKRNIWVMMTPYADALEKLTAWFVQLCAEFLGEDGKGSTSYDAGGAYALGWVKIYRYGNLYDPAANNRGHDNRYWYPTPEGSEKRYMWEVELTALDAFNDTLGEEGGRYLSDAEKDQVVAANGIPTNPERGTAPPN